MIGKTIFQYRILEKLGEGGMGEVYLAEDAELGRKVALKFLSNEFAADEEALARFKREAQTAAALHHPNIITIYEVGQYEDRPYIAMAYIEGAPLGDVIGEKAISIDGAIDVAVQVCDGLGSAHDAGVVHRDVKPDNIFLDENGRVHILDFGLAKLGGGSRLTGDVSTFGTIYYMSPEQVRGDEVDRRSDIFSFGSVLYEMLTGKLPFEGAHSAAIIYSITNEDPKPPSFYDARIPPELDRIVARAMAKNPEDRYRSVRELSRDLNRFKEHTAPASVRRRGNWQRYLLPTSVVFLAVALIVIFKPFRFEIGPDQKAVAAENSLAIMYFENFANPDDARRLGEIVTNLLITDLSESEYLDVVSGQRLYDILKLQGKEGEKVIDKTTATDVASHAGAKWMLLGSILQEEPHFVVTSQLVDVESGKVSASQRVVGGPGEKIFSVVDHLTEEIRGDLALPAAAMREEDAPVAEVTTHSTEAYRYYLEGRDYLNKYYGPEARASFQKALEHDSTFAMVYLHQANNLVSSSRAEKRRAIEKAVEYSDRVSKKERHYIESASARFNGDMEGAVRALEKLIADYPNEKDAYKALGDLYRQKAGDLEKAIAYYRRAIEIDPLDKWTYNILAYQYQAIGDIDNYIWAIYQYISLAPDEANPYDSRADLYAYSGKVDKAIKSYGKALERKPDFYPSLSKLGHMHLFKGEYDEARDAYMRMVVAPDAEVRSWGRALLALVPFYQGRMKRALEVLDQGIEADRAEGYDGSLYARKFAYRARAYATMGDFTRAFEALEKGAAAHLKSDPGDAISWSRGRIDLLAMSGEHAGAEAALDKLKRDIENTDKSQMREYWTARGFVELEKGDAAAACTSFESASVNIPWFTFRYHLARALLAADRPVEAVAECEAMVRRFSEDRAYSPVLAVKSYYYLGVAYEESGRPRKAVEQYNEFLRIWKSADPGIVEVDDARRRVRRLEESGIES